MTGSQRKQLVSADITDTALKHGQSQHAEVLREAQPGLSLFHYGIHTRWRFLQRYRETDVPWRCWCLNFCTWRFITEPVNQRKTGLGKMTCTHAHTSNKYHAANAYPMTKGDKLKSKTLLLPGYVRVINSCQLANIQGSNFICRWLTDENERITECRCFLHIHLCPVYL